MTNRLHARRRCLALALLMVAASMVAVASTAFAESLLPDLIVRPELLHQTEIDRQTEPGRELLRLTTGTANRGLGPLELRGGAVLGATEAEVNQRVYRTDGTWFDRLAGVFTYHPSHGHVHFDDWTVFRLRESLENDGVGEVVAQGSKVSFCLLDFAIVDPANPAFDPSGAYFSCGFDVQGISPGWGDTYAWWLPDQWIDITDVPDGTYWLEVEVDPDNRLIEADETNNVARVLIRLRPPEALPDRYEENDSFDEVASQDEGGSDSPNLGPIKSRREIEDLSMDDDVDLFLLRLGQPAESTGFVRIDSPWSVGDLNLAVYDSDQSRLVVSTGPGNAEQVSLAGLPAGDYFIQVTALAGTNPAYELIIDPSGHPCPTLSEDGTPDADGDRRADDCDNCPAVANPDQADSNHDGAGDACQPGLSLAGIVQDGGEFLEVRATAGDPQRDPLQGTVIVSGPALRPVTLPDALQDPSCDLGFLPEGESGKGIGFAFSSIGEPALFDMDAALHCDDGAADYLLAAGACEPGQAGFEAVLLLVGLSLPADVCVRRSGAHSGGNTLRIEAYDQTSIAGTFEAGTARLLEAPFEGALPRRVALPKMASGRAYELVITVTDGATPPVTVRSSFLYSGEKVLLINTPPIASLAGTGPVECTGPDGGLVSLDATGSSDPDSSPGTHDDLVSFEWFEDFGASGEKRLGSGERLSVNLPLGSHQLTLRVMDSAGEVGLAGTLAVVRDPRPPSLSVSVHPPLLWPPDHRMVPIEVAWKALDLCDPSVGVELLSAISSEPDDASGAGDGATKDDIQGAEVGTPDSRLRLRSERAAGGPGRTYTLTYQAVDDSGNASTGVVVVTVPRR